MSRLFKLDVSFGCDPEFFFTRAGKIFGAEKVLPENGLSFESKLKKGDSKIIIDGVQAELNPRPSSCRANLGNEISSCFRALYEEIKQDDSLGIDFSQTVSVSEKEMESLSDKSKEFGCAESNNIYREGLRSNEIKVNPKVYRSRSAGGHIHLGGGGFATTKVVLGNPERLVPMLDLLVGNTCVLLDRDKGNIERRKTYGKAGEFRTPPHGIEYRTLSNFWLRSYQLMGLVMGLARFSICVVGSNLDHEFLAKSNMKAVERAINTNNFDLAKRNFDNIVDLWLDVTPLDDFYPIYASNIKYFNHFVKRGLDYWFKEHPFTHWLHLPEGHATGFETFLSGTVKKDLDDTK